MTESRRHEADAVGISQAKKGAFEPLKIEWAQEIIDSEQIIEITISKDRENWKAKVIK